MSPSTFSEALPSTNALSAGRGETLPKKEDLYEGGVQRLQDDFSAIAAQFSDKLTGDSQKCFLKAANHLWHTTVLSFENDSLTKQRAALAQRTFRIAAESFYWTYEDVQNYEEQQMFQFVHRVASEELVTLLRKDQLDEDEVEDIFDVLRHRCNNLFKVPNSYLDSSAPSGISRGTNAPHLQLVVGQSFAHDRRVLYNIECAHMTADTVHDILTRKDAPDQAALDQKLKELDHADELLAAAEKLSDEHTKPEVLQHANTVRRYVGVSRIDLQRAMPTRPTADSRPASASTDLRSAV